MSAPSRTALIIGAGIGGLAAGVALRRAGWTTRIYERASAPRSVGFGIALLPKALRALEELGVADPIADAAAAVGRLECRRADGRVLRRFNTLPAHFPAAVALRCDLHRALLDAAGDANVTFGADAVSFEETVADVTVRFDSGETSTGSVLIGADGIHSTIRSRLHPGERPPRASGFCAVRGVACGTTHHLKELSGVVWLDHGVEAAAFRASKDAVYWYLSIRACDVTAPVASAVVGERGRSFEPLFRSIVCATEPEDMRFDVLYERDPLRAWGRGRVTLLGDAAHPVLPHTGQGAAQAMEDAVAIGLVLSRADHVQPALRKYETVRSRRTRRFVLIGPRIARVTTTKNPAIEAARSVAIRLIPDALLALSARQTRGDPHASLR